MRDKFNRWLAKTRLTRRYRYLHSVNKILEEYITTRIMNASSQTLIDSARKELIAKQNEISESENFMNFLRKIKL